VEGNILQTAKYKRIVLKLSGEALAGTSGYGIDNTIMSSIARQVVEVVKIGVEVAIVVGGGNIWRGVAVVPRGWIGPLPITWECWQQL
jgi:uridylate kinase